MRVRVSLALAAILVAVTPPTVVGLASSAEFSIAQAASLSPDQAAQIARGSSGGRVLDVRTVAENGELVYLVRILMADGRVRIVAVNATTGSVR